MTSQLLVRLPDELVRRLRRQVPARQRSSFVRDVLERALPPEAADPLYEAALAVEADERLSAEMSEWDATLADGLADTAGPASPRR